MAQFLEEARYDGKGLEWCMAFNDWKVGIKNYKVENGLETFGMIERHLKTDEAFILLEGRCFLIVGNTKSLEEQEMEVVEMEKNTVYTLKQSAWHNMITFEDTKMILVEEKDTGMHNSEVESLPEEKAEKIKKIVMEML